MNYEKVNKLSKELAIERENRNKQIIQQLALQEKNYWEIGQEFGISKQQVLNIAKKFNLRFPMRKGTKKHQNYLARLGTSIRKAKAKK